MGLLACDAFERLDMQLYNLTVRPLPSHQSCSEFFGVESAH